MAQAQTLLDRLAHEDARTLLQNGVLLIAPLITLQAKDQASANNVLRYWLKNHQLTMPSQERLQAWGQDLAGTRSDKRLQWIHDGRTIRAWRGLLQIDPQPSQERVKRGEWIFVPVPPNSQTSGFALGLVSSSVAQQDHRE